MDGKREVAITEGIFGDGDTPLVVGVVHTLSAS